MKIVIDIAEEKYDRLMKQMQLDRNFSECEITPLPKGHGRLIDADKAIKLECGLSCGCNVEECGFNVPCKYVRLIQEIPTVIEADSLPSVNPHPKTGEWIEHFDEEGKWYECDQCHTDWGGPVNFCPNCGSKMSEGSEE